MNTNEYDEYEYWNEYLGSFVQNDANQDKELNRRIGLAAMTFGKLQRHGFYFQEGFIESKKLCLFSHGFIGSSAWSCRIMGLIQNPTA